MIALPSSKGTAVSVKSLPGSLSMEGVLDRESRCHSTWQSAEAISIGRVETGPALRERSRRGR